MRWRDVLHRASLIPGLLSLVLALWAGTHLQHLIDDGGGRHVGETIVTLVLALFVFGAGRYGSRSASKQ